MKNQGFWITRIVALALFIFVSVYMGYHIFSAFGDSVQTVTAVLTSTAESLPVSGVVARDENVFSLPPGLIEFTAAEAERVSAGQTIAVSFQSEAALRDSVLLSEKTARRNLLNYIFSRSEIVTDTAALDAELRLRAGVLLADMSSGQLSGLSQQSAEIKALLFHQDHSLESAAVLLPRIGQLDEEIAVLSSSVSGASTALRADNPGLFSSLTDGLEAVWTPDALKGITVSEYISLNALRSHPPEETKGRLVRGWTWRFVSLLPAYQAKTLGNTASLRFTDGFSYMMTVEYVSSEVNGECVVVFSSDRYINRVISERRLQGELVYKEYEGVRIPWEGLRVDEETGEYYVYCLLLGRIVRKNVTLYSELERDSYYLAEYHPGVRTALLPGDEIIIAAKDPYDGKVIR
ncbi:MAG: hypothetical protein LBI19_07225 [Oscillospiraceae bacterium]|jgi:hypothetical protein|nr:hypothetical protein [Oscillospiraceae bacterium]